MADIRAGAVNQQAVTVKEFQRLMDSFTSNLIKTIDGIFQKYSVEMPTDLPARKDWENNQNFMLFEDKESIKMEVEDNTVASVCQADAFTELKQQQVGFLLQFDIFGNKLWIYRQRIELTEHNSKKSLKENFNLKKISSRRERAYQLFQFQINNPKPSKIKSGEGVTSKELMKKKDWKKYRKKGIMD